MMTDARISPHYNNIICIGLEKTPPTHDYIKYNRIIVQSKLDTIRTVYDGINEIILDVESKSKLSGINKLVYGFLLERTYYNHRNHGPFSIREHGLLEYRTIIIKWINFLSSNLNGVYIDTKCAMELEKIVNTNIRRIKYTVKKYDDFVLKIFNEQKKNNKYRILRWIQKYTIGKGYTPAFVKVNVCDYPAIKYVWDFS
jgi:hypothetical protein